MIRVYTILTLEANKRARVGSTASLSTRIGFLVVPLLSDAVASSLRHRFPILNYSIVLKA